MFEVPLGAAVLVVAGLAFAFWLLSKLGAGDTIEVPIAALVVILTVLIMLGAFHYGPLYHAPPPVHRGFH